MLGPLRLRQLFGAPSALPRWRWLALGCALLALALRWLTPTTQVEVHDVPPGSARDEATDAARCPAGLLPDDGFCVPAPAPTSAR